MAPQRYSIIDVETTGKGLNGNRITEICIVLIEDDTEIEKFTSLVNPESIIPPFITGLTGIDNAMVKNAPKFDEIADEIERMTRGSIFVAHNVNFDYNVIRSEFRAIGRDFNRKKLCTVRLSRKLIPKLYSYSLGKLCTSLGIPLNNRHRAEGDTDATVLLFKRILSLDPEKEVIRTFLHARSKEATLPPHINKENIENLPEKSGIYLFLDQKGKIIYVGKAKNIRQRVTSHFYSKKNSEYLLAQETYRIDFEETGNELIALLLEAEQIAKHYPKYNRAQKKTQNPFCIVAYKNRAGAKQLTLIRSKYKDSALDYFFTRAKGIERLEQLCEEFELCPRFCGLQDTNGRCSHYKINSCNGVCVKEEAVADYNVRVDKAIRALTRRNQDFVISCTGRNLEEKAIVLVREGIYRGYGYIGNNEQITDFDALEKSIIPQKNTYHTERILKSHIREFGDSCILTTEEIMEKIAI
ncbi:exonuclease domain-containing protein [Flavimarina sp. Hel_I_48]|uniref:exonuclease domain-containing protein n=1 Tax=Flavimarina sp. Hel_I_48 TaxID=1392488 RepID=UPI0004DFB16A|nr:exonuclease domain-containing protein [Flavimarina sp. Hel_I_48]